MDGKSLLSKMKRLGEVKRIKDLPLLTHAMFPGPHCPLMGAMIAVRGIRDAYMLLIGTEECAYYTKAITLSGTSFGGVDNRCMSVILDRHDVTFGAQKKIEEAFDELVEEFSPRAVFLVGTCITEIIGEDIDALAEKFTNTYSIYVMAVHTEHIKRENHNNGIEETFAACLDMMSPQPRGDSFNVLGRQNTGDFSTTEVSRILTEAGVPLGMAISGGCTVEAIEKAAGAKVNLVIDSTGLLLATGMQKWFGIPYVHFERFADPLHIKDAYNSLFDHLGIPLPLQVETLHEKALSLTDEASAKLSGTRYIYGVTPCDCFAFNAFMVRLGMMPQLIQVSEFTESENPYIQYILDTCNPYVTQSANTFPLQYLYDEMRPHIYFGYESSERLRRKGIALIRSDHVSAKHGYEVTEAMLIDMIRAAAEAKSYEKERGCL